jgi:hypothetical protein
MSVLAHRSVAPSIKRSECTMTTDFRLGALIGALRLR